VLVLRRDRSLRRVAYREDRRSLGGVAVVSTLDDATRFRGAHQVESYLGLVPCEWSSSEIQRRGPITKAGNGRMRWLLVQAAWCILRRKKRAESVGLREWADRVALRRGRRVAVVALARRLAGILYAIWRDGTIYDPARLRRIDDRRRGAL
jgi:transposase